MTNRETIEFLETHDNYLIINHRRPDGDAVGCAAALCLGLRQINKRAVVWKNPETTERYQGYLTGLETETVPDGAVLVSVDLATEGLLPLNGEFFAGKIRLSIDHHVSNEGYAEYTNVQPAKAACGEILLEILKEMGEISSSMADSLYLAISTDTGCFQYANVTGDTLRAAAELKEMGVNTYAINKVMFGTKTISRLRMEAALTESAEFYGGGLICVCTITRQMIEEFHATEDDLDDISGFPRGIEGVGIGVMLRELREGGAKLSIRTGGDYNASEICSRLGGGGHRGAAGASDPAGLEQLKRRTLESIRESGVVV